MKTTKINTRFGKLIPVLSEMEKQEMQAYHAVYKKHVKAFSAKALEELKDHPAFGKIVTDTPPEVHEANSRLSLSLQEAAILLDDWLPYIEYQVGQGIGYAKMGLDFSAWYEIVAMFRKFLVPFLLEEYGEGPSFLNALNGMNRFMDIAMGIIGEAYMEEKNSIILNTSNRLSSIFEAVSDMIFMLDVEEPGKYRFSSINKAFEKITGYAPEEIIGKYAPEIIPPDSRDFVLNKYRQAIETKSVIRWEHKTRYPNNTVTGEVSITPFFDENGNCYRLLGTVHDITELKEQQAELSRLNEQLEDIVRQRTKQLEAVNKELESFTYSVSHDLRAPLRAINGYSEILKEDYSEKLDSEGKRFMNIISANARRMGKLIDDLLTFSRLGRAEMKTMAIDMNRLVQSVMKEINEFTPHHATVRIGRLHPVEGDYNMLVQVMLNLISNAIKYSSRKEAPVVEIASELEDGEVIFSVKDNGAGFDMAYAGKLFGVFQRLHTQEEFEGTGVGLALVHQIVTKHGGRVWAHGEVDKGAEFYFSLNHNHIS
jgi:PAS domain S-box-containing protein